MSSSGGFLESFKEKLRAVEQIIDEDKARRKVLWLCDQHEPKSFDEYSSSGSFRRLEKFESSTYSEVLRATNLADNRIVVMKIMRALSRGVIKKLPSEATKGCQSYGDILNEIVITQALSELHKGVLLNDTDLYKTHFFCRIYEIKVVSGNLEKILNKSAEERRATGMIAATSDDQQQVAASNVAATTKLTESVDLMQLNEDDRMLIEALPYEYVVSVMKHDGKPLWYSMTHKKLTGDQLTSVLVQVIVGLAIAEKVYNYEHRDLHVSNILIKTTTRSSIPFVLANAHYSIESFGVKATIIDATFSRLSHKQRVYHRDLTSTLRAYGTKKTPVKMSLQNRSYRQMVHITRNNWESFTPKTNLIWLTYLCETLMKNEVIKSSERLSEEVKKIRDLTLKSVTTMDLLKKFPLSGASTKASSSATKKAHGLTSAKSTTSSIAGGNLMHVTKDKNQPNVKSSGAAIKQQQASSQQQVSSHQLKVVQDTLIKANSNTSTPKVRASQKPVDNSDHKANTDRSEKR